VIQIAPDQITGQQEETQIHTLVKRAIKAGKIINIQKQKNFLKIMKKIITILALTILGMNAQAAVMSYENHGFETTETRVIIGDTINHIHITAEQM
jgi:predicted transposase YbfD/YdcC